MVNKIAILSGPYKEHLSSEQVGKAIVKGLKKNLKKDRIELFWLADGGRGTAKRLADIFKATKKDLIVTGPNYKKIKARIYLNKKDKVALFDVAEACGLHLLKEKEKNPQKTTTYGVGEIIKYLIKNNFKDLFIGLGDTGTNDGGIGILQALGWTFYNENKKILPKKKRFNLNKIKLSKEGIKVKDLNITCLCDGTVTLYGKNGMSSKGAIKKGADAKMVKSLEKEMINLNNLLKNSFTKDLGKLERCGCGGGIGATLCSVFKASLVSGTGYIFKKYNLLKKFKDFDLIIATEGEIDRQTVDGKVPYVIAKEFNKIKIPTIILTGSKGKGFLKIFNVGVKGIFETDTEKIPLAEIKKKRYGLKFISKKAEEIGYLLNFKNGKKS